MTLGEAIKRYRTDHSLSQTELAELLQIKPMTISRLESGQRIRINSELAEAISDLLADRLDEVEEEARNLLNVKKKKAFLQPQKPPRAEVQKAKESCLNALQEAFSETPVVFAGQSGQTHWDVIGSFGEKKWLFDLKLLGEEKRLFVRDLANGIGTAAMEPGVSRCSLVWCSHSVSDVAEIIPAQTFQNLNFDVTFLHYNLDAGAFDFEQEITTRFDGSGFFDLAVPGKAEEAAKLYARWKAALTGAAR